MSRNAHFALHGSLAGAYAPDAERSAEGDILGVSAYDLRGLREDDAAVRLGVSAYDLAGLREDDAAVRMGVSAYDLSGLREDDAAVRLGVSAYDLGNTEFDGATGSAEGSAAGHRVAQMGGVLVSNGRIGGMVEDHYDVRLGVSAYDLAGLREDDADVRMGVSAYDLSGLREDDADVRMGDTTYGSRYGGAYRGRKYRGEYGTEYTGRMKRGGGRRRMGDVDDMGAEAYAIEQYGRLHGITKSFRMGYILRGLREDDAAVRLGVSAYDLAGLREDDAAVRLGTSYAEDASGSAEDPAGRAGMGVSAYDLGRRRAFTYSVDGAEMYPPAMLNATGFHERFPVRLMGLGRIRMGNIAWSEALPRIQTAIKQEAALYARVLALPDSAKGAILTQVSTLNAQDHGQLFKGVLTMYLNGGEPHWIEHEGTQRRLFATETLIPTVDRMITAYENGATPAQALQAAMADVDKRIADLKDGGIMKYALPIGGGVVGLGLLTALVLSIK